MKFQKQRLAEAKMGYSVASFPLLGTKCLLCAPEGEGPGLVFPSPGFEPSVLATEPGGSMGFAAIPGNDGAFFMITGFYPVFKAEKAGIHLFEAPDQPDEELRSPWIGRRVLDLPFVHRIVTLTTGGETCILASTVCGGKDFKEDWAKPGKVYLVRFPDSADSETEWGAEPVLEGIRKNHGLNLGKYRGREALYVSGTEGVFALYIPTRFGDPWESERIIDHEVSEVYPFDFDGDGKDEIAVIEPFHGDTMAIYKQKSGSWERLFETEVSFGHGLWAGNLAGCAAAIVGNRTGSKNLCCFLVSDDKTFSMEELVIDPGAGTTNVTVVELESTQRILASNPEYGEYALYDVIG